MEPGALQDLTALFAELWERLEGLQRRDASLFAFAVVGLIFFEALALGGLLDLLLPRHRPVRGRRGRRE